MKDLKKSVLTLARRAAKSTYRFFDAIPRTLFAEPENKVKYQPGLQTEDKICVVLDRGMGDFILFAYYLKKLMEYYASLSEELWVIADTYSVEFLRHYVPEALDKTIVLERDGLRTTEGIPLSDYRGAFRLAILPMYYVIPRGCQILRILSPNEIFSVGKHFFWRKYSLLDYTLFRHIKTFGIQKDFYPVMHREFFRNLCGTDCGLHLTSPVNEPRILREPYFVVNVDASSQVHLPTLAVFLTLSKRLAERYNLTPVIIGRLSEQEKELLLSEKCIVDFANKYNFRQTIALCEHARLIVTTDTGIYHLAMSIPDGAPTLVPTWGYYNPLFEPYPESVAKRRLLYVSKYKNCAECPKNKLKCYLKRTAVKHTVSCVSEFTPEDMFEQARTWLDDRLQTGGAL